MKKSFIIGGFVAAGLILGLISVKGFEYYNGRIFPRTSINGVAVGGLTIEAAIEKLENQAPPLPDSEVVVAVDDLQVSSSTINLGVQYAYGEAASSAFERGKLEPVVKRFFLLLASFFKPHQFAAYPSFNPELVETMITDLKIQTDIIGEHPHAILAVSGAPASLTINPGSPGRVLEVDPTIEKIQKNLVSGEYRTEASVASTSAQLSSEQIDSAKDRSLNYIGTSIIFETERKNYRINDQKIISFLTFPSEFDREEIEQLIDAWGEEVEREPQNAIFDYDPDKLVVKSFVPPRDGLIIDKRETLALIINSINELSRDERESNAVNHSLPLSTKSPDITLDDTNELGIKERIGFGDSEYAHSIPNRIHNVKITTDRITNTIVAPGEEFSFNKTLGEVSSRTGFRSAYVIKNGRTELGDGGGVCQVSTTLFRAILDAGLKITRRLPHSYRVSYYELDSKPGIDATVYSGNIDLRFVNDTDNYLLIHGEADSSNVYMYFEIYGTNDGRTTEIVDHEVWGAQPAPPPQYFEDPEKPVGYREQVDWPASGIKTRFTNVIKDSSGKIIREDEYYSNYRPWSAKYVIGTKAD